MDHYAYRNLQDPPPIAQATGAVDEPRYELCCEWIPTNRVIGVSGTPTLVYSQATIVDRFYAYAEAYAPLRPMVCWAASCCHELEILRTLLGRGAGFEVTSGDDLERAWLIGASSGRVLFSGAGKQDDEIRAALDGLYSPLYSMGVLVDNKAPYYRGPIGAFIVEDAEDLDRISRLASAQRIACRVLLRRAGRDAFGFSDDDIRRLTRPAAGSADAEVEYPRIRIVGLATQTVEPERRVVPRSNQQADQQVSRQADQQADQPLGSPTETAVDDPADLAGMLALLEQLHNAGVSLSRLHLARGFDSPSRWPVDDPVRTARRIQPIKSVCERLGLEVSLTAPRSLVGQSAVLLTRVLARTFDDLAQRVLVDQPLALDQMNRTARVFAWPTELLTTHRPGFGVPINAMPGLMPTEILTASSSRPPRQHHGEVSPGALGTRMPPVHTGDVLAIFHDRLPDSASRHGAAGTAAGRGIARVLVSNDKARLLARRLSIAETVARDTESVDLGL